MVSRTRAVCVLPNRALTLYGLLTLQLPIASQEAQIVLALGVLVGVRDNEGLLNVVRLHPAGADVEARMLVIGSMP
jgi:hypothetical protein